MIVRASLLILLIAPAFPVGAAEPAVRVGSKAFTENVILGEIAAQLVRDAGKTVSHRELGGTQVVWKALLADQIDIYPEYTGTITQELLTKENVRTGEQIRAALAKRGIEMTKPLGFSNNYMIGMLESRANELGIERISQLARHPELKIGLSNEFLQRDDGWSALRRHYNLPQRDVRGLEHDLAYRALADGKIDCTDFYSTDGRLAQSSFVGLIDDKKFFPNYQAVLLFRSDLRARAPEAVEAIRRLEGALTEMEVIQLNAEADVNSVRPSVVAAEFLSRTMGIESSIDEPSDLQRLLRNAARHLQLVFTSLLLGIAAALPLGVVAAKRPRLGQLILAGVGIIQTIPSIVLLVLLIRPLGVGERPAIFALFVYSLLPIVRNTHAGLSGIAPALLESAEAIGLGRWSRLWRIELPLASRSILAGIKTAAVINVGTATLGGFIGAGGFGQPIFQGLRGDNWDFMVWQGAVPTALLSLLVLGFFELVERLCVPRGLRLPPASD